MAFDGITVAALVRELQNELTGGRIYKIAQPENDELLLTIKTLRGQKRLFLSAGADEVHQYFVPGRHASIWDVLIDVSGGIVGMAAVFCLKGIVEQWNHIRERESKICF